MKHTYTDFKHRIFRAGILPNLFSALFIFLYSACIISMPLRMWGPVFCIAVLITAAAEFLFAPLTNILVTGRISWQLEYWKTEKSDETFRTDLLRKVMIYPLLKGLETFIYFLICAFFLAFAYDRVMHLDRFINMLSVAGCIFGAYISMLLALAFSERLCSEEAEKIFSQGVSENSVMKHHYYGLSLKTLFILYIVIPSVYSGLLAFLVIKAGYIPVIIHGNGTFVSLSLSAQELEGLFVRNIPSPSLQMLRMVFVSCTNIVVLSALAFLYFHRMAGDTTLMQNALSEMNSSNITDEVLIPTDLSNEMSYTMYLINRTLFLFRRILEHTAGIGNRVIKSVQDLVIISRETASTSLEQSAGVKEILATMEETDRLSHTVENKIGEVHTVALKTSKDVESGAETVRENLLKMQEITAANNTTIAGIRSLCDKINGIWDIVTMINSVTDQTKIIAFNAELEASDVSEAGCDFRNVAGEIRALADNTTVSTGRIKEQIQEIQTSSDNLIITARSCMEKISEGGRLTQTFESRFDDIRRSSEQTASFSDEIGQIITQQSAAFEQIVVTLRQISAGVENFSSSAQTISGAAANLRQAAGMLDKLTDSGLGKIHSEEGEKK
ncbi:MAG: methyl-accepting chemotaxis protein [Treponema sp.]|nr:methyl-accepting chemotaxis protein [Treponema sp.]